MCTTMNFTLLSAILCILSWISVSRCEFHVVEVQTGEEVTLLCTNYTSSLSDISWFRLKNGSNTSPISSMLSLERGASYFDGFEKEKFNMTSNVSNVFLQIKQVDLSDSGLYICGYNMGRDYRKSPAVYSATYLKVKEKSDEQANLTMVILMGCLIIVLIIIIIALVLKIWKLHTAHKEAQDLQDSKNVGSDDLNYAGLSFLPTAERSRRPAREREPEPNVVYATTMHSRNQLRAQRGTEALPSVCF
ncbi:uncharacterized protein LOC128429851 isoform X1 [Pleuronectes platessa]|uniref:uncharacterized protein LOC128429851 isoform X1 n=1 Tax=Pleuronectes platessa TaxID=8262 RepID=UPI00232A1F19|nr:uncharacterized protein LOC128429851 isoform X1 [Pleuronectes platessa]